MSSELRKNYQIDFQPSPDEFPGPDISSISKTLSIVQAYLEIINYSNLQQNNDLRSVIIGALGNKQLKQAYLSMTDFVQLMIVPKKGTMAGNSTIAVGMTRKMIKNITFKTAFRDFFNLYGWVIDTLLHDDLSQMGLVKENFQYFVNAIEFLSDESYNDDDDAFNSEANTHSRTRIYEVDPQLEYLTQAIACKYQLQKASDIRNNIRQYLGPLDFQEFADLESQLTGKKLIRKDGSSINIELLNTDKNLAEDRGLSNEHDKLYDNYEAKKIQALYGLLKFYIGDLTCFSMEESYSDKGLILDSAKKSVEENGFMARDRRSWLRHLEESIKDFEKSKKNSVAQDKAVGPANAKVNIKTKANDNIPPTIGSYTSSDKTSVDELIVQKKLQVYKKFSRKHPHIMMDEKINSLSSPAKNHNIKSQISTEHSLFRNIKVLVQYRLVNTRAKSWIAILILNLVVFLVALFFKRKGEKVKRIWKLLKNFMV
ncbi:hypothetical protein DASC09_005650 [Saccharomycopsis crataegensis]|uniref:Uncharacterized protein n=1 Tax=Saccharomycopsis crataegensis TaxID=43959 RepID=A0AAV5QFK4_9ASCO|nr:hypothetical protein DASC09_005650 [Saccharomycopsis crataegensis]